MSLASELEFARAESRCTHSFMSTSSSLEEVRLLDCSMVTNSSHCIGYGLTMLCTVYPTSRFPC
jgi:hypothetical protein